MTTQRKIPVDAAFHEGDIVTVFNNKLRGEPMLDIPETPEGVALTLVMLILSRAGPEQADGHAFKDYVLGLFARCLQLAHDATPEDHRTVRLV